MAYRQKTASCQQTVVIAKMLFNIRKRKYLTMFDKIQNKKVDVEEKTNKSCHV